MLSPTIRRHEFEFGLMQAVCKHCGRTAFARVGVPVRPHETISAYVIMKSPKGREVIPSRVRCIVRPRPA